MDPILRIKPDKDMISGYCMLLLNLLEARSFDSWLDCR